MDFLSFTLLTAEGLHDDSRADQGRSAHCSGSSDIHFHIVSLHLKCNKMLFGNLRTRNSLFFFMECEDDGVSTNKFFITQVKEFKTRINNEHNINVSLNNPEMMHKTETERQFKSDRCSTSSLSPQFATPSVCTSVCECVRKNTLIRSVKVRRYPPPSSVRHPSL